MAGAAITARIVWGRLFVNMGDAKIFARNATEMDYVCITGSSQRASFAMRFVPMAHKKVSVMLVLLNAEKSRFSVSMGTEKKNAANAKCFTFAYTTNAGINARNVGGRDIVSMDGSEISARIAVEGPYVGINASITSALFVVLYVLMEKKGVDAIYVRKNASLST